MKHTINPHTGFRYKKQAKKGKYELIAHFKTRLAQRYHISISDAEVDELVQHIEARNYSVVRFIDRQSCSRSLHEAYIQKVNKWIPIIYNDKIKMVVTALPENYKDNIDAIWNKGV